MEQKTEYFILKTDGLYWVKDMPGPMQIRNINDKYPKISKFAERINSLAIKDHKERTEKAIASSIPVSNQEEVIPPLVLKNKSLLETGEIYQLECEVEIKESYLPCNCIAKGSCFEQDHLQYCDSNVKSKTAFVSLPGKEETKEECPCENSPNPCSNTCTCSKPYMSGGCSRCNKYGRKQAVTKEEELSEEKMQELSNKWAEPFENKVEQLAIKSAYYSALKYVKSNFIITKRQ